MTLTCRISIDLRRSCFRCQAQVPTNVSKLEQYERIAGRRRAFIDVSRDRNLIQDPFAIGRASASSTSQR